MRIIIKDNIKYLPHHYKSEDELEAFIKEYIEVIFGSGSLFFEKNKIESKAGIGSIPDGFVLSLTEDKWFVVEVELSDHPLYNHIVPQLTKFYSAIKNYATRRKLVDAFYDEIRTNVQLEYKFKSSGIKKELYKVLTDIINKTPDIVIIIDAKTKELEEICETLPFSVKVLEFETYYRENSNLPVHLFDTLKSYTKTHETFQTLEKITDDAFESRKTYSYGDETLNQILEVAELVLTQGKSYNDAVKIVAEKRKIHQATVRDKCTRRLGLTTSQFKNLLGDKENLITFLIERFPDRKDIINERLGGKNVI